MKYLQKYTDEDLLEAGDLSYIAMILLASLDKNPPRDADVIALIPKAIEACPPNPLAALGILSYYPCVRNNKGLIKMILESTNLASKESLVLKVFKGRIEDHEEDILKSDWANGYLKCINTLQLQEG